MALPKGRQDKQMIQCLQILKLLELGDGEGDVSIQQVEGQIPVRHTQGETQVNYKNKYY